MRKTSRTLTDASKKCLALCIRLLLIGGCEILLDVDNACLDCLQVLQTCFLHQVLGLALNSIITPLYTEMGLLPLRVRRVQLALRYLVYLIELPPHNLVCLALQSSNTLRDHGIPVGFRLGNLPFTQFCFTSTPSF